MLGNYCFLCSAPFSLCHPPGPCTREWRTIFKTKGSGVNNASFNRGEETARSAGKASVVLPLILARPKAWRGPKETFRRYGGN